MSPSARKRSRPARWCRTQSGDSGRLPGIVRGGGRRSHVGHQERVQAGPDRRHAAIVRRRPAGIVRFLHRASSASRWTSSMASRRSMGRCRATARRSRLRHVDRPVRDKIAAAMTADVDMLAASIAVDDVAALYAEFQAAGAAFHQAAAHRALGRADFHRHGPGRQPAAVRRQRRLVAPADLGDDREMIGIGARSGLEVRDRRDARAPARGRSAGAAARAGRTAS